MPLLTFGLPALIATLVLVAHASAARGWRFTLEFFGLGLAYFAVKEHLSAAAYFHVYTFTRPPPLAILGAPPAVVVGWLFAAYVAWTLADRILGQLGLEERRLVPTVLVAMVITASIAYPIEAIGTTLGWWTWSVDGAAWSAVPAPGEVRPLVAIPMVPLIGWPLFVGGFLLLFMELDAWVRDAVAAKVTLFALGAGVWFLAIHGIGTGEPALLLLAGAAMLVLWVFGAAPQPREAPVTGWRAQGVELALGAMGAVVLGYALLEVRSASLLLTMVPLGLFALASRPPSPVRVLAGGAVAAVALGIATGSPPAAMLAAFPALIAPIVLLRAATRPLRRHLA